MTSKHVWYTIVACVIGLLFVGSLFGPPPQPTARERAFAAKVAPICEHGKHEPCWYMDWDFGVATGETVHVIKFDYEELTPEERDQIASLRAKFDKRNEEIDRLEKEVK